MLVRPIPDPVVELISRRLEALAEPTRIRLIDLLDRSGEVAVHTLADELGLTGYNVSQHLGVLRDAGVVRRRQEGRTAHYRLADRSAIPLYEQVAASLERQLRELGRQLDDAG